jgi:hypothetical protein
MIFSPTATKHRKEAMTDHPAGIIEGRTRPAFTGRRSARILSLRDVADVEAYVIETIHEAALSLSDGELDELVASGIESVYRLERALPPQRPLRPLLDHVLSPRLAELWGARGLDRPAPVQAAVAIAA